MNQSEAFFAVLSVVIVGSVLSSFGITVLKGKWISAVAIFVLTLGLMLPITAIRLAKPESWWARRFYDEPKLRRSVLRHEFDKENVERRLRSAKKT